MGKLIGFILFLASTSLAFAQTQVPNTFTDGEVIDAEKFNENFDALESAIDNIPAGPQGEQGVAGPLGPQGSAGADGTQIFGTYSNENVADPLVIPPGEYFATSVTCDLGDIAIGANWRSDRLQTAGADQVFAPVRIEVFTASQEAFGIFVNLSDSDADPAEYIAIIALCLDITP